MTKLSLACCLTLSFAVAWHAPDAAAIKVKRDRPGTAAQPEAPKVDASKPASAPPVPPPELIKLTAAQIADKNAAARGGLEAWRAVKTLAASGQMEAGGKKNVQLPFALEMKRPHKQRLALEFAGQTALQVFDGEKGWTLRPYLGRTEPEPFSPEERSKSAEQPDLDGPLIDYAVKGNKIEVEGTEAVEGKGTYRLKLTTKDGHAHHIWIDGTTFLEAKIEGNPRRLDGKMHQVETYLRDYRSVDGLVIPFVSETKVQGMRESHKMTFEKVVLNPPLDDGEFAKPHALASRPGGPASFVPAVSTQPPSPAVPANPQ
jgi:outer membrane lipoprotein-sorting protein